MQDGPQLDGSARRSYLGDEALERLPVLVHEVAHRALLKVLQARDERREWLAAATFGAFDEFRERPQFLAQAQRVLQFRELRVEDGRGVEAWIERLCESDDRLLKAVAEQTVSVLDSRVDRGREAR